MPVSAQTPLAGAVICCTSVPPEQREDIAKTCTILGAVHKYDLTSDVTHLLVGSTNTQKYMYVAAERPDVKVLVPNFLEACKAEWLRGNENSIDEVRAWVSRLEIEHKVPVFWKIRGCLSGFEDASFRDKVQQIIESNGGEYSRDLTRSVTHLIVREPVGKKYTFAVQWNVRVVSIEWVFDSLKRGMIYDESLYDPHLPPEQRGVVEPRKPEISLPTTTTGLKRGLGPDLELDDNQKRKIRRSVSKRFEGDQSLWADITGSKHPKPATPIVGAEVKVQSSIHDTSTKKSSQSSTSLIGSFPTKPDEVADVPLTTPKLKALNLPFSQLVVLVYGFDSQKVRILNTHLTSNGAMVYSLDSLKHPGLAMDEFVRITNSLSHNKPGYIVLPHDLEIPELPEIGSILHNLPANVVDLIKERSFRLATEFWVEKCLFTRALVELVDLTKSSSNLPSPCPSQSPSLLVHNPLNWPHSRYLLQPLTRVGSGAVSGWENLHICCTGFQNMDLLHFSRIVRLMGAQFDESLTLKTNVLVCVITGSASAKLKFALQNKIPAVTMDWFCLSLERCKSQDYDQFSLAKVAKLSRANSAGALDSKHDSTSDV